MVILSFQGLRDSFRFRLSEWGCAAIMAGWGWVLVQPFPTFDNPSFVVMRTWASEDTWGYGALALGLVSLFVMVYNGRDQPRRMWPEARLVMAAARCFVWASIAWGLVRANIWAPGIAPYGGLLVMDLFVVYYASGDAQIARTARHGRST